MSDIRLKPCPFCGSLEVEGYCEAYMNIKGEERSAYSARCSKCGASGPEKPDEVSAADAWNEREAEWMPVSKCLPPDDTVVALLTENGYTGTGIWYEGSWKTSDAYVEFEPVTYWMKLPDIPEEVWK